MNILLKILPVVLCLCFLCGCQMTEKQASTQNSTECPLTGTTPDPSFNLKTAGTDIYYYINSSSATGCQVHIVSMSCQAMSFGKAYYIEKKTDGEYKRLEWKEEPFFIEIAMLITTDSPCDEGYNWEKYLGSLEKGEYRIVTDFYRNGEKITAYFEFTV